jgi:hypothetical protein
MELLGFALSHFTVGPDARRLNELVQASGAAAGAASHQRLQHSLLLEKVGGWRLAACCAVAAAAPCPASCSGEGRVRAGSETGSLPNQH